MYFHILVFFFIALTNLFASNVFSNELSSTEELLQIMEFDQACIIMHDEGSKYLNSREKIIQSYGASALIEQHLESLLVEYSEITGNKIDDVRKKVFEQGSVIFKELSVYQPKDLVYQCRGLVENIAKTNI